MKPTQTPDGFFVVPVPGSRKFRTAAEAQEYCDFIADVDDARNDGMGLITLCAAVVVVAVLVAVAWVLL